MAYNTAYPPVLIAPSPGGSSPQVWAYTSTDPISTVLGAGYFSNAVNVGLKVGDVILYAETDNGYASATLVIASIAAGAGSAGSAAGLAVTAGVGITGGVGTVIKTSVQRAGDMIYTRILLDLTGLNCGGTAGDIIGTDGAGVAYLGQITAQRNGTIFGCKMTCLTAPTGGDTNIRLYAATVATGVEDVAISGLTGQTLIITGGVQTLGLVTAGGTIAADAYLYMVGQTGGNATYTAGRLLIEIFGY